MHEEMDTLIQAIESLKQDANPFKEYVFPIVSGFLSSLLGAGVAYLTLRHQDEIQIEKDKLDNANDWILTAESAFSSLMVFKKNYQTKLTSNPFQRALTVKSIIHTSNAIDKNISSLSFIVPKKEDKGAQDIKWRSISRIRTMVNNYNYILELWEKREEIEKPIKEKILNDNSTLSYADVTKEKIINSVGAAKITILISITEQLIKLTDDILIEIDDFLKEFPAIAKTLINKKLLKQYGAVISFSVNGNQILQNIIIRSPEVDYKILSELYGVPEEQLREEHKTGYE